MKLLLSSFGSTPAHDAALAELAGKPLREMRVGYIENAHDVYNDERLLRQSRDGLRHRRARDRSQALAIDGDAQRSCPGRAMTGVQPTPLLWRRPDCGCTTTRSGIARASRSPQSGGAPLMPKFMDVHHGMHGITPEALKEAHQADVDIQDEENVDFQRAWGDPESGMVWCISEAPDAEAVKRIHERAGHPATEVYPVPIEV